jgi:putative flippase GtrA
MLNSTTREGTVEFPEAGGMRGTTQPMATLARPVPLPVQVEPSYHLTRWPLLNSTLEVAERVTNGKAGFLQRLATYLMVGGFAALVNLTTFYLMYDVVKLPLNDAHPFQHLARYVIAFLTATEVSILANFIPNDRITFSHLPGHSRSWLTRCFRFHITCIAGTLLTLAISFSLHLVHIPAIGAQAIALILVTAFNFTFHHLFTYRRLKPVEVL